jgi:hypothetical protein
VVSLASKDLSATTAEIMRLFLPTFLLDGSVFLLKIFLALTFVDISVVGSLVNLA